MAQATRASFARRLHRRTLTVLGSLSLVAGTALTGVVAAPATAGALDDSAWPNLCNATAQTPRTPYAAGANCRRVTIGSVSRRYIVYVPPAVARSGASVPVVFMFHGSSGTGEEFYKNSRWRETAKAEGFIAVFPTGAKYRMLDTGALITKWHDFSLACDINRAQTPLQDDVAFVDEMLTDAAASEQVDQARLYASGFSNGSAFAQRLAVERGDRFAAVASWAGGIHECTDANGDLVVPGDDITVAANPIPTWFGVGSVDDRYVTAPQTLPVDPALIAQSGILKSVATVHQLDPDVSEPLDFATWNGWTAPVATWPAPTWGIVRWDTPVAGNTAGNEYVGAVLEGVGHKWPNAKKGQGTNALRASAYVTMAEVFWRYFEAHPKPGA